MSISVLDGLPPLEILISDLDALRNEDNLISLAKKKKSLLQEEQHF